MEGGRLDSGDAKGSLKVDEAVLGLVAEAYEERGTCVDLDAVGTVTSAEEEVDAEDASFSFCSTGDDMAEQKAASERCGGVQVVERELGYQE